MREMEMAIKMYSVKYLVLCSSYKHKNVYGVLTILSQWRENKASSIDLRTCNIVLLVETQKNKNYIYVNK